MERHLPQQPEHLLAEDHVEAAAHVPTEQDEEDVPPLTTVEHHIPQQPEHLPAEEHGEGPQTGMQNGGGPMTRSRTRARNRYML